MTAPDEITAAHDDVVQARARMADTVAQIEARVTGQMDAVKAKLDVVQMIRDNPWTALAVATGVGVALSATGADRKVASAASDAAHLAAEKAKEAASAAAEAARAVPSQASEAGRGVRDYLDEVAASAVTGLIAHLKREDGRRAKGDNVTV